MNRALSVLICVRAVHENGKVWRKQAVKAPNAPHNF
jgi:hypothetical protein